jgi:hypothetical protein
VHNNQHSSWNRVAGWLFAILLMAPFIVFGTEALTPQPAMAEATSCPVGQSRINGGACHTIATCPGGSIASAQGVCSCPAGTISGKTPRGVLQCIKPPKTCPPGKSFGANGLCVSDAPTVNGKTCPVGKKPGPAGLHCIPG